MECKSALSRSGLPGLDRALNPYRGCAHRCAYCYAQDVTRFEMAKPWGQVVEVKANIVARLKRELEKDPTGVVGVGTVTDPYQPLEKEYELTRGCLAALKRKGASASILTKSDLVLRDLDILRGWEGAEVGVSIACVDPTIASILEPGAPSPDRRFMALERLAAAGVRIYLMAAPVIAGVSDSETLLKALVSRTRDAGVTRIMWDKFNRKPIAGRRLLDSLDKHGLASQIPDPDSIEKTRSLLGTECRLAGIDLSEAF